MVKASSKHFAMLHPNNKKNTALKIAQLTQIKTFGFT